MLAQLAEEPTLDRASGDELTNIVALCREGNVSAWKKLYDGHFDFAYRTARRLGAPDGDVEDVVHEAFEIAFRKLEHFQHGLFSTWLYRIVANLVSARLRKRRVRDFFHGRWSAGPEPVDESLEPTVAARQQLAQVAELMRRLSPEKREVFALHELEGLTHEQIAELVGCKVETVRTRLHYARKDFEKLAVRWGLER